MSTSFSNLFHLLWGEDGSLGMLGEKKTSVAMDGSVVWKLGCAQNSNASACDAYAGIRKARRREEEEKTVIRMETLCPWSTTKPSL